MIIRGVGIRINASVVRFFGCDTSIRGLSIRINASVFRFIRLPLLFVMASELRKRTSREPLAREFGPR